jgi:hypothetical protein
VIRERIHIEPIVKILDNRFDPEYLSDYLLFILAGPVRTHVCVVDADSNRCLAFESYSTEGSFISLEYIEKLGQIIDGHSFMSAQFWKGIYFCIANDRFTLVPESLFKEENSVNYLKLNCEVDSEHEKTRHHVHKQSGIVNIFSLPKRYEELAKSFYPNRKVQFLHHTSPFIEACLRLPNNAPSMMVCVGYEHVTLLVKENKQLKFCNKFFFKTDEDFLYYLFLAVEELGLNTETPLILLGEISPKTNKFALIKKYFGNFSFGHRPSTLQYGFVFDEIPDHAYLDLFAMSYCL